VSPGDWDRSNKRLQQVQAVISRDREGQKEMLWARTDWLGGCCVGCDRTQTLLGCWNYRWIESFRSGSELHLDFTTFFVRTAPVSQNG